MAIPEFSADSSIYRAACSYRSGRYAVPGAAGRVMPQQRLESTCGSCVCDPGKCCYQSAGECACHTCSSITAVRSPSLLRA